MPTTVKMNNIVRFVVIENAMLDGAITEVDVNGYEITNLFPAYAPVNFPLYTGNSTTGETDQIGTHEILVKYSGISNNSYIQVTDSDLNVSCQQGISSGGNASFLYQVVGGSLNDIYIYCGDGDCP
jgi:hypothetical protein